MEDKKTNTPMMRGPLVSNWFEQVFAMTKQELQQLVYTPITLIFQSWFLLALSILIFAVADFLSTDLATFDLLWTFLPWVSIVLVPVLAMRAFAQNIGDRGFELLMSFPVSDSAIVVGKWLGGAIVLIITLAMTAPFIATVAYLGSPDWGIALSGYIGAALLLISFYALALFAASLTRDQVVAYILSLSGLTVLLILGWDVAARTLGGTLPDWVITALVQASPKFWLGEMSQGQIHLAAIIYFIGLISLCLVLTIKVLKGRRIDNPGALHPAFGILGHTGLCFCVIVLLGASVSHVPYALDMTKDKIFTLHPETIQIAKQTPDNTKIDFYYSSDESAIPASIRHHAKKVKNLLDEVAGRSNGKITIVENYIAPDSSSEEQALISGVRSIPMTSGDQFMLGAVFRQGDRESAVSYFDQQRAQLLEYDLALMMNSLNRKKTPRIGILTPLLASSNIDKPREGFAIFEEIKRQYDVTIIPHFHDQLPENLDVLLIVDAPILKKSMLLSIDQHVMNNRGLIAILDPYPRFNSANAQTSPQPSEEINDISDILAAYGIIYQGPIVIGDSELGAPVAGADGRQLIYPYWLRPNRPSMSTAHGTTASLNELLFAEAGSFKISKTRAEFDRLIVTGESSGTLPRDNFKQKAPGFLAAQFTQDKSMGHTIAVAMRGEATSAYGADDKVSGEVSFKKKTQSANVFAIADADWLFDPMAFQTVNNGGQEVRRPLNDNVAFILNMIEFSSGDPRLVGIRSRGGARHSFTTVADILQAGRDRYVAQEADYANRIAKLEASISEVMSLTGATDIRQLPDNLQSQIKELRKNILPFRQNLREIREKMREDVEKLEFKLNFLNFIAGPVLAVLFAALMWARRRRKTL
ncbi:MAG: Gldg family protein [Hyphomicrobiales bacterium]